VADTAWTVIKTEDKEFRPGDSVSGLDDETMAQLKAAGAVRNVDYPDDVLQGESVRERNIRLVAEKMEELQSAGFDISGEVELVPTDFSVIPAPEAEEEEKSASTKKATTSKTSNDN
jgi:hypothetical protein